MGSSRINTPGWLTDWTESTVRGALEHAAPDLCGLPIALDPAPDLSNPNWAFSRAKVGDDLFAKFALSEPTAVRVWHEAQMVQLLGTKTGISVAEIRAASRDPALFATRLISGGHPLDFETVAAAEPQRIDAFAEALAGFLTQLHAPDVLALARAHVDRLEVPSTSLEVSTEMLRDRFLTMVDTSEREMVRGWCDWIDQVLASPTEPVLVHGDFHPYNQIWDLETPRLLAVVDFESAGPAEPEFDFRGIPAYGPDVALLVATVGHYEAMSQRKLNVARIMALHVLNSLGDALWRTEAGFPLPPPGDSPSAKVREAADRLAALGFDPSHP